MNADLIAGGLSPLRPELAARQAGRLVLQELSRLASARKNFAFESTLSGRTYLRLLNKWKSSGYRIEIVFCHCHRSIWRSNESQVASGRAAMMSQDLTSYAALIAVGKTSMTCTALMPTDGQSMIIQGRPLGCWRESHEEKSADGEYAIRAERRARTPPSRQNSSKNCQDVRDADLRVGKRQGGGEETLRF